MCQWDLRKSPVKAHNRGGHLEAMTATLLNHYRVLLKQNVQYAVWYFVNHTKLNVVALTFATRVFKEHKLTTNPVQHAEKTTLKSILTRT